jgi:hypothetical protein
MSTCVKRSRSSSFQPNSASHLPAALVQSYATRTIEPDSRLVRRTRHERADLDHGNYRLDVRTDDPGPLTQNERALLDALLAHEFAGVESLRAQLGSAQAKRGCQCGCGTIEFVFSGEGLPLADGPSPVPAEGRVLNATGEDIGGLLLFLEAGLLGSLEVYSYDDPLPLPTPDRVLWDVVPRSS